MRLSRFFLPTSKDVPAEAQIVSHRLMLRAGLIRQAGAGIYSWLPFGLRALRNIERIVRAEQDRSGAQEMLMPTIQSADLWRESGRFDDYGAEMLRIVDRHGRDLLYGPTTRSRSPRFSAITSGATGRCRRRSTTFNGSSGTSSGRASESCGGASS